MQIVDLQQALSFAASLAAVVLSLVVLALTLAFYRMAAQLSASAHNATRDLGASVTRLEGLFDRVYAETFAMMRDVVADLRTQVAAPPAPPPPPPPTIEPQISALRAELLVELAALAQRLQTAEMQLGALQFVPPPAPERPAVPAAPPLEPPPVAVVPPEQGMAADRLRDQVNRVLMSFVQGGRPTFTVADVFRAVGSDYSVQALARELLEMRGEGLIHCTDLDMGMNTQMTVSGSFLRGLDR